MTAYRDTFDKCPRCAVELTDAGSARACTGCSGQWLAMGVLQEMVNAMQVPQAPFELDWIEEARPPIPCPECNTPMETWRLAKVSIDRCPARHGVWFDRDELELVLRASARVWR